MMQAIAVLLGCRAAFWSSLSRTCVRSISACAILAAAFFFAPGLVSSSSGTTVPSCSSARRLRSDFLRAYRGSISPEDAPLLAFDIAKARAREEPFIEGT